MRVPSSAPLSTCFIDTNIWLYAFIVGSDVHKHHRAAALIRQEPRIAVSTQVINEVSVNLLKKAAFAETDIQSLIVAFYQRYQVLTFDRALLELASRMRERYQLSFWDGFIVAAALTVGSTTLYSEDMHNGLQIESQLTIVNPFEVAP